MMDIPLKQAALFTTGALISLRQTISTSRWVATQMFSKEGRRFMRHAVVVMFFALLLEQLTPLVFGKLVALHTEGHQGGAWMYILTMAVLWVAGIILLRWSNALREWGWNCNTRSVRYNLTREWLRRTPGEVMEEDRDIGANQIESSSDKMHHVQQAIYFQLTNVLATLTVSIGLVTITDLNTGMWLVLIVLVNVVFIFFMNHHIHIKMGPIDAQWRRFHNRLVEYWHQVILVVASSAHDFVLKWVAKRSHNILWEDYVLWGRWYQVLDGFRSTLTTLALCVLLYRGYFRWETDELVAIFSWIVIYREQFWRIADIQRTLAEHTERLHALREAFEKEPAFDHEEGLVYEKGG